MNKGLSIEDEVLGNIRRMPLGPVEASVGTVEELDLPLEFLRRAADRIIQVSFRERWRAVMGEGNGGVEHVALPPPTSVGGSVPGWVTVLAARSAPASGGAWTEHRPADRSFRAPILSGATQDATSGFVAIPENGTRRIGAMRVQLTGPGYYAGPGDGGSLDILRQLVTRRENVIVYASVEQRHAPGVLAHFREWTPGRGVRVVLIPEAMPVSQWARDNAVAGTRGEAVHLLAPRWAGRGEEGGIFIPGESFLMDGLAAAGLAVSQSRLLFEGGNVMLVEDGTRRVLLVGEAEVHRNVGLQRDEVLGAFKEEFGADLCVVLPAASFHIDLELTVGSNSKGPVAFVLDTLAAVRTICRLASGRLREAGLINASEAADFAKPGTPLPRLGGPLNAALLESESAPGKHGMDFAMRFRAGDVDSGVGNLQRVRFASDWLMAELGVGHTDDGHYGAYLRSLRRAEKDRAAIARQLKQLGWRVLKVPGISAESVSLNPVNGLWFGGDADGSARFLIPAYGGFFEEMDDAAAAVFRGEGLVVEKVMTGETQRRGGGLHCAVGLLG